MLNVVHFIIFESKLYDLFLDNILQEKNDELRTRVSTGPKIEKSQPKYHCCYLFLSIALLTFHSRNRLKKAFNKGIKDSFFGM